MAQNEAKTLQKQLIEALEPLQNNHPEIRKQLPDNYLEKKQLFAPSPNQINALLKNESDRHFFQQRLKYIKCLWIITKLVSLDPTIMEDSDNAKLKKLFNLCLDKIQKYNNILNPQTLVNSPLPKKK